VSAPARSVRTLSERGRRRNCSPYSRPDAIISGETQSVDLPLVAAAKPQCNLGFMVPCGDGYIAKLDPRGAALVFSTYVGARAGSLALDAAGTVYAAGATGGSGLPIDRAPQPDFGGGDSDGFAMAYSPMGQLLWSTYVGGSREDAVVGIGAARGVVYFGGVTARRSTAGAICSWRACSIRSRHSARISSACACAITGDISLHSSAAGTHQSALFYVRASSSASTSSALRSIVERAQATAANPAVRAGRRNSYESDAP